MKPYYFAVVAVTIDGFIARFPGHKVNWTSKEDKIHLHKMEDRADVLLLARTSYEVAKKHLSKRNCLVITRKINTIEKKGELLTYINPQKTSIKKFIKKNGYKKICVLGGRGVYNYTLEHSLIDDIFLTIEPVVFGEGIGIFNKKVMLRRFNLISIKKLNKKGTILLHYRKK